MAFSKIIAESMDLTDTYAFTGTLTKWCWRDKQTLF